MVYLIGFGNRGTLVRIQSSRPSGSRGVRSISSDSESEARGFKSRLPDQFLLAGSKVAMRSAVNGETRRFESYPASQIHAGDVRWSRTPLLQRGSVEFDSLPRYHFHARLIRMSARMISERYGVRISERGPIAPLVYRMVPRSSKAEKVVQLHRGAPIPLGGRLVVSRESLKLASSVRF